MPAWGQNSKRHLVEETYVLDSGSEDEMEEVKIVYDNLDRPAKIIKLEEDEEEEPRVKVEIKVEVESEPDSTTAIKPTLSPAPIPSVTNFFGEFPDVKPGTPSFDDQHAVRRFSRIQAQELSALTARLKEVTAATQSAKFENSYLTEHVVMPLRWLNKFDDRLAMVGMVNRAISLNGAFLQHVAVKAVGRANELGYLRTDAMVPLCRALRNAYVKYCVPLEMDGPETVDYEHLANFTMYEVVGHLSTVPEPTIETCRKDYFAAQARAARPTVVVRCFHCDLKTKFTAAEIRLAAANIPACPFCLVERGTYFNDNVNDLEGQLDEMKTSLKNATAKVLAARKLVAQLVTSVSFKLRKRTPRSELLNVEDDLNEYVALARQVTNFLVMIGEINKHINRGNFGGDLLTADQRRNHDYVCDAFATFCDDHDSMLLDVEKPVEFSYYTMANPHVSYMFDSYEDKCKLLSRLSGAVNLKRHVPLKSILKMTTSRVGKAKFHVRVGNAKTRLYLVKQNKEL